MRRLLRRSAKPVAIGLAAVVALVLILRFVPPVTNLYQLSESWRLGGIERDWVALRSLPSHVPLSAAAAEDANFCVHWGFDLDAIRTAVAGGARRGASTVSQQTAKNVFLWQDRSWVRKGLEVGFTVLIEALWSKRRIMEVYLNVAEFDEGVFGIEAAARHYYGVAAADLSRAQAARLMAVLPDPKRRSPAASGRSRQIAQGADTLAVDGRGFCLL
ncbi:monofunctional biosynthetic peptidoglycan transglycosylase [Halovulum dunhuangense]|nr:monofunctional biosynthetic peptidoglycan transglycosylase [Halovulum dunhuangense]